MSSHDVRITLEHYENGGFSVVSSNYEQYGISTLDEAIKEIREIMLKELGLNKLKQEK
jgi:hypothetical protein